jgi:hypothetical protein
VRFGPGDEREAVFRLTTEGRPEDSVAVRANEDACHARPHVARLSELSGGTLLLDGLVGGSFLDRRRGRDLAARCIRNSASSRGGCVRRVRSRACEMIVACRHAPTDPTSRASALSAGSMSLVAVVMRRGVRTGPARRSTSAHVAASSSATATCRWKALACGAPPGSSVALRGIEPRCAPSLGTPRNSLSIFRSVLGKRAQLGS